MTSFISGTFRPMVSKTGKVSASALHYDQECLIESSQTGSVTSVIRPISGVNSTVWEFEIPSHGPGVFTNMSEIYLCFKCKITKGAANYANGANVVFVNNLGQTVFKLVEVRINDFTLPGSTFSDANIRAYINTILNTDKSMLNALQSQGFYLDDSGMLDDLEGDNKGVKARQAVMHGSREFTIVTPINADFLKSQSYLGPGNKLSIRLERASDKQVLMCPENDGAKLTFTDMKLYCTRIHTENVPLPPIETHLIPHTELLRFPMAANTTNILLPIQQTGGFLPRFVAIFFIKTEALNGKETMNMLKLEHMKMTSANLRVCGASVPAEPLTPDFEKADVTRELHHLFQNIGTQATGRTGLIDRDRFMNGFTIFPFDLTPDKCGGAEMHECKEGTIMFEGTCTDMGAATTAFAYMTWDMEVSIDRTTGVPGYHDLTFVTARK